MGARNGCAHVGVSVPGVHTVVCTHGCPHMGVHMGVSTPGVHTWVSAPRVHTWVSTPGVHTWVSTSGGAHGYVHTRCGYQRVASKATQQSVLFLLNEKGQNKK